MSDPAVNLLTHDVSLFLDGAEVTIASMRAGMWDYRGSRTAVPAILVQYTSPTFGDRQPEVQAYTVGRSEDRYPSDDGRRFHSATKQGLPQGCNGLRLLESFVAEGFPKDRIAQDVTVFEGCRIILGATARPKTSDDKAEGERTVLLVRKLLALPEAASEAPKAKAAPAPSKGATAPLVPAKGGNGDAAAIPADLLGNEEARLAAIGAILELLGDDRISKPIKRQQLAALSFKLLAQSPSRNAATKLLGQYAGTFLPQLAAEQVLSYDPQTQTISGAA
jgi:hypothetical protein